jgi:hypothetical protein
MKAKMNHDQQATNRIFDEIDLIKDIDFVNWQKRVYPYPEKLVNDKDVPSFIKNKILFKQKLGIRKAFNLYMKSA